MGIVTQPGVMVFLLGAAAALVYPVLSLVALRRTPSVGVLAVLTAFGGGALVASLLAAVMDAIRTPGTIAPVLAGWCAGAVLYVLLHQSLGRRGAFLRKSSTLVRHVLRLKRTQTERLIAHLSRIVVLESLPPREIARLIPHIQEILVPAGFHVFEEGDHADALYLIGTGRIELLRSGVRVTTLSDGECFGEMALITGAPRNATVVTLDDTILYRIPRQDFELLLRTSPETEEKVRWLVNTRSEDLINRALVPEETARAWKESAVQSLADRDFSPTLLETREIARLHGLAFGAVGGGQFLDLLPRALLFGALAALGGRWFWPFWGAWLVANSAESLSVTRNLAVLGFERRNILGLWIASVFLSALGAWFGWGQAMLLPEPAALALAGLFAGAALAMTVETMLPESMEQGGAGTTLAVILGGAVVLAAAAVV